MKLLPDDVALLGRLPQLSALFDEYDRSVEHANRGTAENGLFDDADERDAQKVQVLEEIRSLLRGER